MTVSIDDVTRLKTEAEKIKSQRTKSEATISEIEKQINGVNEEIKNLGFDPENAESELLKLNTEIDKEYREISSSMPRL